MCAMRSVIFAEFILYWHNVVGCNTITELLIRKVFHLFLFEKRGKINFQIKLTAVMPRLLSAQ